jgi:hypothetical protein
MRRLSAVLAFLGLVALAGAPARAVDRQEGGYAGTTDQGHDEVVYNFLKHFHYEQYYYAYMHQWTWNNDNRVDAMNFAVFGGHGNTWYIQTLDGGVDLANAGPGALGGYGTRNAKFIAFESCDVVTSPLENADWYTKWTREPNDVFDGVHQILGFHTLSWQSTDQNVTDTFGSLIAQGFGVWESWFAAINSRGRGDEFGSAVMYPPTDGESYAVYGANPPANMTWLRIWYQH